METLFEFSPLLIAIVPVVVGLVTVAKNTGLKSRYAAPASIVAGIALVALTGVAWQVFVVQGIIAGLAASGLYSGGKSVLKG